MKPEPYMQKSTEEHDKAEKARRELRNFKVGVMSAVAKVSTLNPEPSLFEVHLYGFL